MCAKLLQDKVTGEIFPGAVELWKPMDLSNWVTSNWNNSLNLGEVLKHRIFIYVGTWDNYYLNEGVMEFQKRTDAAGGAGWANVTILPNQKATKPKSNVLLILLLRKTFTKLQIDRKTKVSRQMTWSRIMKK